MKSCAMITDMKSIVFSLSAAVVEVIVSALYAAI
jgi:hypothetical protein